MATHVTGITGGMGAGKTTLALKMAGETGALFINIDDVRRRIGGSDADGFETLWHKISAQVRAEVEVRIARAQGPVVLEWARLIEDGYLDLVDEVVVVHCDDAGRMQRLAGGDLTPAQIRARLEKQMDTQAILSALDMAGKPYRRVNTGSALDAQTPFCLFRIPRTGGRVIWEVTNSCNYGCRYCIFSSTSRKVTNELDTQEVFNTIDALKACGFTHVKFTGGEPFMRPDMLEILRYARQAGLAVDISTNAAFITEAMAHALAELGLEMVHVSLDGHTQVLQEAVRGKNTFAPTMAGLKALGGKGVYIRIGCVIYKDNQYALREMVRFCHEQGFNEVIFSLMEPVGRMRGRPALLCERPVQELQAEIEVLAEEFAGKIAVSGALAEGGVQGCGVCPGASRFLFIDHKGGVSPCTWVSERVPDYVALETLRDKPLAEILHGGRLGAFRRVVNALAQAGCPHCPMRVVPDFFQATRMETLFEGDLAENLKSGGRYTVTSPVYAFTTENIGGYLPLFGLAGKDVLTVGGAGDQMINAYAAGARSVVNFDINALARPVVELKLALLQALPREAFCAFWDNPDERIYARVQAGLSASTRLFFDAAYRHFSHDSKALRASPLFRPMLPPERNNPYLADDAAYEVARAACAGKELVWHAASAGEEAVAADGLYDVIWLSNIADYAHMTYEGDYMGAFCARVVMPMATRLRSGGQMMIAYVYDALDKNGSCARSRINDTAVRQATFGALAGGIYREVEIASVWEEDNRDCVLCWEKTA